MSSPKTPPCQKTAATATTSSAFNIFRGFSRKQKKIVNVSVIGGEGVGKSGWVLKPHFPKRKNCPLQPLLSGFWPGGSSETTARAWAAPTPTPWAWITPPCRYDPAQPPQPHCLCLGRGLGQPRHLHGLGAHDVWAAGHGEWCVVTTYVSPVFRWSPGLTWYSSCTAWRTWPATTQPTSPTSTSPAGTSTERWGLATFGNLPWPWAVFSGM